MYSYQKDEEDGVTYWEILDPHGDVICDVRSEISAKILLSHLNK